MAKGKKSFTDDLDGIFFSESPVAKAPKQVLQPRSDTVPAIPVAKRLNVELSPDLFELVGALAYYRRQTRRQVVEEALVKFAEEVGTKNCSSARRAYREEQEKKANKVPLEV
jgi:predicted transcriptional regulator